MSGARALLLGAPLLECEGEPIRFDTRKNLALAAYLAVTGETHTREALVTLLWPEMDPSRARANLRRNLSVLRKTLGGSGWMWPVSASCWEPGKDMATLRRPASAPGFRSGHRPGDAG